MSQVPIVKIFTMGDCMAAQRRCENSSFEHAHYGALRFRTCAYRPVKGVELSSRVLHPGHRMSGTVTGAP